MGIQFSTINTDCITDADCQSKIDQHCHSMEKDYVVNAGLPIYMTEGMHGAAFFSMLADLFIAALIYFNKELHVHPMKLFMLVSLAEASYF